MARTSSIVKSANAPSTSTRRASVGSDELSASQEDLTALEKKFYDKLEEYDKKSDDRQIKAIEALGIFVALFSFISINIQVFSRISSAWSAGLFMVLIFCALSMMLVLLDLLLIRTPDKVEDLKHDHRVYLMLSFVVIGGMTVFSLRSFPLNPLPGSIEFEEVLNTKVSEKINFLIDDKTYPKASVDQMMIKSQGDIQNLKDCLKSGGWNSCLQ